MKIPRSKGTRDLSPEEMTGFRLIESAFRDACLNWGYQEVKTPTLENLHLFTTPGTLTPRMLSRVYSFLDWDGWSGERLVLRPDGTIPIARLYIDNMEDKGLAKLFYVANVFIFEPVGSQTRERWQCGVELIGARPPLAEVELITMALDVLKKLKLDGVELRLSHAGLIKALLAKLGLTDEEQTRLFDRTLDGDKQALAKLKLKRPELKETLASLLKLQGKPAAFRKELRAICAGELPEFQAYIDDCTKITDLLDSRGCDYQLDIASGRGFEYYTGAIFQLFRGKEKIGGGGRYDALIPLMGGRDVPAAGFALYLERLMKLVKPEALPDSPPRILVKAETKEGFDLAARLHQAGYGAEIYLGAQKEADFDWTIAVREQSPAFVLSKASPKKQTTAGTIAEVLKILKG